MKTSKRRVAKSSIAVLTYDDSILPIEIIFEILLKLPVKTLLKMKCVSKSWSSLISSPEFIKTHLKLSSNNPQFSHQRLLSISSGFHTHEDGHTTRWRKFLTYSLYALLHGESNLFPVELHNFSNSGLSYEVLCSCDGLFLLTTNCFNVEDLFVWNPSIKKLKKLPYTGRSKRNALCTYGFGYSECPNDYKIVEIVTSRLSKYEIDYVFVYSLRTNSWKKILEHPSICLIKHVKFVNGNLHWISGDGIDSDSDSDSNKRAAWLNPGDETFGTVALPKPSGDTFNWKLVSSAGNLCMTCDYRNKTDVWIMKEYGVAESWTNVASIPKFVNKVVWPIFISQSDEILLQDISGLVWWYVSTDDDTFDRPDDQTRCECDKGRELILYVESLVSP